MLLSMTGYGRARRSVGAKTITIEIRSLNSKFTDVRIKLPQNYKEKEIDLRKHVIARAKRGKIDVSIDVKSLDGDVDFALNKALFSKYYNELQSLTSELGAPPGDFTQAILRLPNVVGPGEDEVSGEEWNILLETLNAAIENFLKFRQTEGHSMELACVENVNIITALLKEVPPFEAERKEKLKARIHQHLAEYVGKDNIDANRFEQEILYYLEKLDISEEKVRLEQHCTYFLEVLDKKDTLKGKKLSFIAQEMGREINTLGSKANSSDIQRVVVKMKDELEKIKEQVANSL